MFSHRKKVLIVAFILIVLIFLPMIPVDKEINIADVFNDNNFLYTVQTTEGKLLRSRPFIEVMKIDPSSQKKVWSTKIHNNSGRLTAGAVSSNSNSVFIAGRCYSCSNFSRNSKSYTYGNISTEIVALDKESGKAKWRVHDGSLPGLVDVVSAVAADSNSVYVANGNVVFALASDTGETIWSVKLDEKYTKIGNLSRIYGLSVDQSQIIYVLSKKIILVDPITGTTQNVIEHGLGDTVDIEIDGSVLYFVTNGNDIQYFKTPDGKIERGGKGRQSYVGAYDLINRKIIWSHNYSDAGARRSLVISNNKLHVLSDDDVVDLNNIENVISIFELDSGEFVNSQIVENTYRELHQLGNEQALSHRKWIYKYSDGQLTILDDASGMSFVSIFMLGRNYIDEIRKMMFMSQQ